MPTWFGLVGWLVGGATVAVVAAVVAGAETGELWLAGGTGVLGGATMLTVERAQRTIGRVTALLGAGVCWAAVLAVVALASGRGSGAAAWLFMGMLAPWLFWLVTVPVKTAGGVARLVGSKLAGLGRGARVVRQPLWEKPWRRDWAMWLTAGGVLVAAILAVRGWWMLVVAAAGVGPVVAALRLAWRGERARSGAKRRH